SPASGWPTRGSSARSTPRQRHRHDCRPARGARDTPARRGRSIRQPSVRPLARARWIATIVAVAVGVVAIPLALLGVNLRSVAVPARFHRAALARHDIGPTTRLSREQLHEIADAFTAYFQSAPSRLDVQVVRGDAMVPLFNEREIAHMEDVQALIQLVFTVQ